MASTTPNETRLRQITLATLIPAFPIIVASGVMSGLSRDKPVYQDKANYRPTIIFFSFIPTFTSALASIVALGAENDSLNRRSRWVIFAWFLLDTFLALANLAVLIPIWMYEPDSLSGNAASLMLETYATVFLMSNMFIHAYLALYPFVRALPLNLRFSVSFQADCPRCSVGTSRCDIVGPKRQGYSLVRAEHYLEEPEDEPSARVAVSLSGDSEA